jgi:hypothetical protein
VQPDISVQGSVDPGCKGEHPNAHEQEVGSLDPAPLTQVQFAARVVDRVITRTARTLDQQNGSEHNCRSHPDKKKYVGCHAITGPPQERTIKPSDGQFRRRPVRRGEPRDRTIRCGRDSARLTAPTFGIDNLLSEADDELNNA